MIWLLLNLGLDFGRLTVRANITMLDCPEDSFFVEKPIFLIEENLSASDRLNKLVLILANPILTFGKRIRTWILSSIKFNITINRA